MPAFGFRPRPVSCTPGISVRLRDLDTESLRGVPQASVVAVQTPEALAQAHDGRQVQGVE